MARRLTKFSKLLITIAIVAAITFGAKWAMDNTALGDQVEQLQQDDSANNTSTTNKSPRKTGGSNSDDVIKIGVVTWGGYAGGQYFNEGFEANTNSRFYKDYGFKVEFVILDDFVASRAAWKNDEVDLLWATIDAFPTESSALAKFDPVVVFQADWSRGGDAVVVSRGITKVSDLRGKSIAVGELSPSHSFFLWLLKAGDLTTEDVNVNFVGNAIDAAAAFKSKSVDAAVVWSPDDEDCVNSVSGARVLESTRSASHIIADVFIAKKAYVENNEAKLQQLYEGWMIGAAEINRDDANKRKAAKILADAFEGFDETLSYNAINNVRLCTHGDNLNFFGLNPNYKNITGERLYTTMTNVYKDEGVIKSGTRVPNWRLIRYSGLVENANNKFAGNVNQRAEGQREFAPSTSADEKKDAIATKAVSINFRSGEFALDPNAKNIIDREFVDIAQSFSNSKIRVEGNTDNTGNYSSNVKLSKKRAQSVVDYLISEYGMPRNRFIIVGNGPDNPVASNNTENGRAKNRRTDFELVPD
ncbi:MAG: phosphate ABC transporter substrate-binding/OmpA family protein [Bacteroidota bacterium]